MGEEYSRDEAKNLSADALATASFVFGVVSLVSTFCCCPFVFSALGIILALISKGGEKVLRSKAKTGLVFSCIGMVVSIVIIVFTVALPFVLIKVNPEYKQVFVETLEESLEENENTFRGLYGDDEYEGMKQDMLDFINDL